MSLAQIQVSRRLVSALSIPLISSAISSSVVSIVVSGTSGGQGVGFGTAAVVAAGSLVAMTIATTEARAQFANSQAKTVIIPAGTTFEGRMDSTVSSRHSHQGDRFNIILSSPVLANGMDVVIPAGSQVVGEVVEALPAGDQPHAKGQKPNGKLRTQMTALRTPDGMTYPLVASFIGESIGKGANARQVQGLGSGVAYVGGQSNFNAVYPVNRQQGGANRGPQLVTKKQMMDDPLYGDPDRNQNQNGQQANIRSLVKDHREIYIHQGSPMSVRLDAPLRMAIVPVGGMSTNAFSDNGQSNQSSSNAQSRPNFTRARSAIAPPPAASAPQAEQQATPGQSAAPAAPARDPSIPSFLDPVPGQKPPMAAPQWSTPTAAPQANFNAQGSGFTQAPQSGAPQAPPASFAASSMSPAEQAASIPQSNPFSSAGASGFKAAPQLPPQSPPQSFNAFSAPPAQAPQAQSLGSFGAAPAQAPPAPSTSSFSSPPAQAAPQAPAQAPAAQSLFAAPAAKTTPPPPSAPSSALSAPQYTPPPAPPAGQSLDNFIDSLKPTAAPASPPAAGTPATPAAGSLAAPPAQAATTVSAGGPPSAPVAAAPPASTPAAAAKTSTPTNMSSQSVDSFINSLSNPSAAAQASSPVFAAPAQAVAAPATPQAQPTPSLAPPKAAPTPTIPRSAPGDNF